MRLIPPSKSLSLPLRAALFLLILDAIDVGLGHTADLDHPVENLVAVVPLHDDFLPAAGRLRHAAARRELFPKLLGHFFEVETVRLEPADGRHVFALVALHPLDQHLGRFLGFGRFRLRRQRPRFFLQRILLRPLLGVHGQGGEGGCDGFCFWPGKLRLGERA